LCQHIFVFDPEVNPLYSLAHYGSEEREQRERKILDERGFTQALP
jgi:hypothetical protein